MVEEVAAAGGGLGKMIPVRGWQTRGPFEEVSACGELASPLGSVLWRILRTKWSKTPTQSVPTVGEAGIGYCVIK